MMLSNFHDKHCNKCDLHRGANSICVSYDGSESPSILFLGESPGKTEDRMGVAFTGRGGDVVKDAVNYLNIPASEVGFDTVVKCAPLTIKKEFLLDEDGNPPKVDPRKLNEFSSLMSGAPDQAKISFPIEAKHISACSGHLKALICHLKPKVIVPMGNLAMQAITGVTGITKRRGMVSDYEIGSFSCKVVPTLSPAQLLYAEGGRYSKFGEAMTSKLRKDFITDVGKAWKIAKGEYQVKTTEVRLILSDTETAVYKEKDKATGIYNWEIIQEGMQGLVERMQANKGEIFAFDTETESLLPHSKIAYVHCMSFSFEEGIGYVVPWAHPDWLASEWGLKWQTWSSPWWEPFKVAMRNMRISGQNLKYDLKWMWRFLDLDCRPWFDTMLALHELFTKTIPLGLKENAARFCEMETWEDEIDVILSGLPREERLFSRVPFFNVIVPYASGDGDATRRLTIFLNEKIEAVPRIHKHFFGLKMPLSYYITKMEDNGVQIDEEAFGDVEHNITTDMDNFLAWLLAVPEVAQLVNDGHRFSLSADADVRKLLFEYMRLPIQARTAKGMPSVAKDILVDLKELVRDHPNRFHAYYIDVIETVASWRKIKKLKSTYIDGIKKKMIDGIIRTNYNMTGTETNRLSASDPPLHNMPWHSIVKKPFGTRWRSFGGMLLQEDYSQMEMRLMASEAGDEGLIAAYNAGEDIHTFVASQIFMKPKEEIKSDERRHAKMGSFCMIYGGSAKTLAGIANCEVPEAEEVMAGFQRRFHKVIDYMEVQKRYVMKHGYIFTPFGFRRLVPYAMNPRQAEKAKRVAVNTPIQGACTDMTGTAILNKYEAIEKYEYNTLPWGFVHDSIVSDIYPGELESQMDLGQYVMVDLPKINCDWLNIALVADIEIGVSWYNLCEVSNYDMDARTFKLIGDQNDVALLRDTSPFQANGIQILSYDWGKKDGKDVLEAECQFITERYVYPWRHVG